MNERKLNLYLSRILSGYYIFTHQEKRYKLQYPSIDIKYEADIIAEEEYNSVKYIGWPTKDSIIYYLYDLGIWDNDKEHLLNQYSSQIDNYKVSLYKNHLNAKKAKSIRKSLDNVRKNYNDLYSRKHCFDHITIEGYCDQIKSEFLLLNSIYHEDKLHFVNYNDYMLFREVCLEINKNTIEISTFKTIARSDIWRNYWSSNRENLYSKAGIDWTDEQKTLVILTKMYDNARESMECPPDNVFEDDDMFDGWMINQKREAEKEKSKKQIESNLSGKLNKAGEVFLAASSKEEADSVYGMNDDSTRAVIRERQSFIDKNKGQHIKAASLPDTQRDLITQQSELRKKRG